MENYGLYCKQGDTMQIVVDNGKLVKTSYTPCEIPENGYVIVGPESKLKPFLNAKKYQLPNKKYQLSIINYQLK